MELEDNVWSNLSTERNNVCSQTSLKAKAPDLKEGSALQHGRVIISSINLLCSLQRTEERLRAPNTEKSQVQKGDKDTDNAD